MKIRYRFLALICVLLPWSQSGALTIYRLGGASLPPPELPAGAQFVQLQWEAIASAQHGQAEQLSITPDLIEPEQLDPSVNLTPRLKERGGRIQTLVWTGWEPSGKGDAVLWDEDVINHHRLAARGSEARGMPVVDQGVVFARQQERPHVWLLGISLGWHEPTEEGPVAVVGPARETPTPAEPVATLRRGHFAGGHV